MGNWSFRLSDVDSDVNRVAAGTVINQHMIFFKKNTKQASLREKMNTTAYLSATLFFRL